VLAVNPPRRRRGAAARLEAFAQAPLDARVRWLLVEAGYAGLTQADLFARATAGARELGRELDLLSSRGAVALVDREARRYVDAQVLDALGQRVLHALEVFHRANGERDGEPREELRQKVGEPPERTFARALAALVDGKRVEVAAELVRLPGRGRTFDDQATALKQAVGASLARAGLAPLAPADLSARLGVAEPRLKQLLQALVAEGLVVRAGDLFFDGQAVRELEARLVAYFGTHERLTTQAFKELVGQSRKYVIPLAEYFDREKVTLRVGDERTLRRR
jgi:selenocysteine-specific elongation factor